MAQHAIVHVEFSAASLAESQTFYRALFGWKTQPLGADYVVLSPPSGPTGGLSPAGGALRPGDVVVYVSTDDIPATLARVKALGGRVVQPETPLPGVGSYALFRDPGGNLVGLLRASPAGYDADAEAGPSEARI